MSKVYHRDTKEFPELFLYDFTKKAKGLLEYCWYFSENRQRTRDQESDLPLALVTALDLLILNFNHQS